MAGALPRHPIQNKAGNQYSASCSPYSRCAKSLLIAAFRLHQIFHAGLHVGVGEQAGDQVYFWHEADELDERTDDSV